MDDALFGRGLAILDRDTPGTAVIAICFWDIDTMIAPDPGTPIRRGTPPSAVGPLRQNSLNLNRSEGRATPGAMALSVGSLGDLGDQLTPSGLPLRTS